jgi:hypothetical protein
MGRFISTREGEDYIQQYCKHCQHYQYNMLLNCWGCPILDAHFIHGIKRAMDDAQAILDMTIPVNDDGDVNLACAMFQDKRLQGKYNDKRDRENKTGSSG